MRPGDSLLLGTDLVKDPARLVAAYDDAGGVTAAFDRNVLRVLNDRLGADFDLDRFEHVARWDADNEWIEMRLRSTGEQVVSVPGLGVMLRFARRRGAAHRDQRQVPPPAGAPRAAGGRAPAAPLVDRPGRRLRPVAGGAMSERTMQRWEYCDVRALTERLAAPLSAEDQTVQSMPDTSPTKWHRAHTTWFFETFVLGADHVPYDPSFAFLFNSYYEAVGPRHARPERGVITRPGVAEVTAYREHVDAAVRSLLDGELSPRTCELLELGLHHEQQHQELIVMDIQHVLSRNPLQPAYGPLPWDPALPVALDGLDRPPRWRRGDRARRPRLLPTTTRGRATTRCCGRSESPARSSRAASGWPSSTTAGTAGRSCGCRTAGTPCRRSAGRRRSTGPAPDGDWQRFGLAGLATRSTRPIPCSTSAGTRPTPSPGGAAPGCRPRPSGRPSPRPPTTATPTGGTARRGSGRPARTRRTPASARRPGRSASTTASSWSTSRCCGAARWRRRPGHTRRTYRNFFPPASRWMFSGVRLATD